MNGGAVIGVLVDAGALGILVSLALRWAILTSNDVGLVYMVVVRVLFFTLSDRSSCLKFAMVLNRSMVVVDLASMLSWAWAEGGVVMLS